MEKFSERAGTIFDNGLDCAESVLKAFVENNGIHSDLIPKIATGFCSGISRTMGMCGGLAGGIMALGLLYGRTEPHTSHDKLYKMVQKLLAEFKKSFGTTNCYELIQCDFNTIEGQKRFVIEDLLESVCMPIVRGVPQLIAEIAEAEELREKVVQQSNQDKRKDRVLVNEIKETI